ncbi:MAG: MATE family efflux transporter [Candidatus Cloacimonetes bacterium]|nr:MATE family efflux transporter [Candidatus Cloacimonadota bacterium]
MKKSGIDLTQGNLLKNLLKLSLPIMFSNFLQTFYNLTDAFWLGKLGDKARDAVSVAGLAFPLIFFLSSFGFGFVIAGTSLISQYKGAGNIDQVRQVVGQFIILIVLFSIVFITGSLIFLDKILLLLRTPAEIFTLANEFITVILIGMVFMFIFMSYQSFSHGLGDTVSPMKIQIISVGLNVILDPVFIFGIGFFPRLETYGAAIATLIARIAAAILAIYFMFKKLPELVPQKNNIIPDSEMLKKIIKVGIPASVSHSITSFGFLILQGFVNTFGTLVISTFSIGNRIISFFMMPAMGISSALSTVIGQNLGAKKVERAVKSVKVSFGLVLTIMITGNIFMLLFSSSLIRFFINDPEVIKIGTRMIRVTSFAATIFAVLFVFIGVFNGSGHTKSAMIFNISRLWFFRIPLVYILSGYILNITPFNSSFFYKMLYPLSVPLAQYPYDALWWSMLISNILSSFWAFMVYRKGNWKKGMI